MKKYISIGLFLAVVIAGAYLMSLQSKDANKAYAQTTTSVTFTGQFGVYHLPDPSVAYNGPYFVSSRALTQQEIGQIKINIFYSYYSAQGSQIPVINPVKSGVKIGDAVSFQMIPEDSAHIGVSYYIQIASAPLGWKVFFLPRGSQFIKSSGGSIGIGFYTQTIQDTQTYTSGSRATLPPVTGSGSVTFQKIISDRSAVSSSNGDAGGASTNRLSVFSYQNKKYLVEGSKNYISLFSLSNPLNPSKLSDLDLTSSSANDSSINCPEYRGSSGGGGSDVGRNITTVDFVDGSDIGLVTGYCQSNNGAGLGWLVQLDSSKQKLNVISTFSGRDSGYDLPKKLFKVSGSDQLYAVGQSMSFNSNGDQYFAVRVYSVSGSSPFLAKVSDIKSSLTDHTDPYNVTQLPSGTINDSIEEYLPVQVNGKTYLILKLVTAMGPDFAKFHEETKYTEVFDVSSPSSPQNILIGTSGKDFSLFGQFDYITSDERKVAVPNTGEVVQDPVSGNIYMLNDVHYGVGYPLGGIFRNRETLRGFGLGSLPSFGASGIAVLDERVDNDTTFDWNRNGGWSYSVKSLMSDTFNAKISAYGNAIAVSWINSLLQPVAGNSIAPQQCTSANFSFRPYLLVKNSDGTFSAINDNGEFSKIFGLLANKGPAQVTAARLCSMFATGAALVPVDSNTLALYRSTNIFTDVLKISLPQGTGVNPGTGGGGNVTTTVDGGGTQVQSISSPALTFQNLLNIFNRILKQFQQLSQ